MGLSYEKFLEAYAAIFWGFPLDRDQQRFLSGMREEGVRIVLTREKRKDPKILVILNLLEKLRNMV